MTPRASIRCAPMTLALALLAGCGGGLAVVGGDAGQAVQISDVPLDAANGADVPGMDASMLDADAALPEDRAADDRAVDDEPAPADGAAFDVLVSVDGDRLCVERCTEGAVCCSGRCVQPLTDVAHCGGCGRACERGLVCAAGVCARPCQPGLSRCDQDCVDLDSSDVHCGRCGSPCPVGSRCAAGVCTCPPGQLLCGGACVSELCTRGVGACARGGPQRCVDDLPRCDAVEGPPGMEVCNGLDDNCDGSVDEALVRPCYTVGGTPNVGVCRPGMQSCSAGGWGACTGQSGPQAESCNGADDDCNGVVDDAPSQPCFTGLPQNRGVGRCRDGATQCVGGARRCLGELLPLPEICNGADDDCDGLADNNPLPSSCPSAPNAVLNGCAGGQCSYSCQPGFANCDGVMLPNGCEVNLRSDPGRCGSCGNPCPTGTTCDNGLCRASCSGATCGGQCVDTASSTLHCGSCGNRCTAPAGGSAACFGGMCVGSCPTGTTLCGSACVDLRRDPAHCGSCTVACRAGEVCTDDTGFPACTCGGGTIACPAGCVNPLNDPNNCGACGVRCGAGQTCSSGTCRCTQAGTSLCNGVCVILGTTCTVGRGACARTGVTICGTSGAICNVSAGTPTTEFCNGIDDDCDGAVDNNNAAQSCTALPFQTAVCTLGSCSAVCFAGRGDCDGVIANGCETDLFDSPRHCNRCGNSCGNGRCLAGACVPCDPGSSLCGNACVGLATDPLNCGACGRRCADNELCIGGFCDGSTNDRDGGFFD